MPQKAGVSSDGLPTPWPSLIFAPDFPRFSKNFSDGFYILTTLWPSITSASVSRCYWPTLQRCNFVTHQKIHGKGEKFQTRNIPKCPKTISSQ
ncbi:hypothetical protein PIB30_001476 [Stylosanthes scabra]|uniref:Uncharacterized protein n=1 Tax=Stylosanthes scabra TaxID=79078 RepID=A0ABU6Q2I9_9FABA|nr:hypothetical protein [Stylosanthes scabra]